MTCNYGNGKNIHGTIAPGLKNPCKTKDNRQRNSRGEQTDPISQQDG